MLTLGAALAAFAAKPACRAVQRFRWRFLHLFARSTGRSDVCIACMPGGFRHLLGSSLPVELADRCRNRREELPNCPARKRSSRQICRLISQVGAGTAKGTAKLPGMQAKCSSNQPFDLTGRCRSRKSKCETARHAGYAAKSSSSCTYLRDRLVDLTRTSLACRAVLHLLLRLLHLSASSTGRFSWGGWGGWGGGRVLRDSTSSSGALSAMQLALCMECTGPA